MESKKLTKLTKEEAKARINLKQQDKDTFLLENTRITLIQDGLQIEKKITGQFILPPETLETQSPYRYFNDGLEYLIKNENGDLAVYLITGGKEIE